MPIISGEADLLRKGKAMPYVEVNKVKCFETTDGIGKDDLYIAIAGEKVWPYYGNYEQIGEGEEKLIGGARRAFQGTVEVGLWEYDSGSADDKIGTFTAYESSLGDGERELDLTGDGSHYKVFFEVVE
ncbi:hypothetical protein [Streptomyces sp. NPDC058623]|uniref:hypothetical protein n=1 Tax=Streptomyces sp. NPDC058623 TaxID=3346563 RepID=UPI00366007CA